MTPRAAHRALRLALECSREKPWRPSIPLKPGLVSSCRAIATQSLAHQDAGISILPTKVDTSSAEFQANARQMDEVMAKVEQLHRKIATGGSEKAREKHVARKKMLPRE